MGRASLAAVAAGGTAALWGLAEAQSFTLRHRTLIINRQTPEAIPEVGGLRILHLSDIHLMPYQHKKLRWLRSLAETRPDFIVFTGDQVSSAHSWPLLLEALAPFAGIPGAFVYGSNDYFMPHLKNPFTYFRHTHGAGHLKYQTPELPFEQMTADLEAFGWQNLNNSRATAHVDGWQIDLVGVDDPHIHHDNYPPESSAAGRSAPAADQSLQRIKIGLTHAPYTRILNRMAAEGCTAIFAGHTHGGQVCLPGHGALVTNCDLDPKYASGMFQWPPASEGIVHRDAIVPTNTEAAPTSWVNVSAGIGTSPYAPVRVGCRPEAIVVDLALV